MSDHVLTKQTFLCYGSSRQWYFRIHGYGVRVLPLEGHRPLFSERYGHGRYWHVFGCCIKGLKP